MPTQIQNWLGHNYLHFM